MNVNAKLPICGFLVILLLFVIYRTHKRLNLRRESIFKVVLVISMITLAMDTISAFLIAYNETINITFVNIFAKLYLVCLVMSGYAALFYCLCGSVREKQRVKWIFYTIPLLVVEVVAIMVLPINTVSVDQGRILYSEGPAVLTCFGCTIAYILATVFCAIFLTWKKQRRRAISIFVWMGLWILAAIIQLLNNALLLVGFSGALGVLILYIVLETPESKIDKQFQCFNTYAFDLFVRDRKEARVGFSLLEIKYLDNSCSKDLSYETMISSQEIIKFISQKSRKSFVFKNIESSLFVVSYDSAELERLANALGEFLDNINLNYRSKICISLIKNSDFYRNSNDLKKLLEYSSHLHDGKNSFFRIIGKEDLSGYRNELIIEEKIQKALDSDRVVIHIQPIFNLKSKKFETAEVLVRMIDENGALVSPGIFIPVAEKTGLIIKLGERIIEKTCQFIKNHDLDELGVKYLEVNLSIVQCEDLNLSNSIFEIVKKYNIPMNKINFEITETGMIQNTAPIIENMNKMLEYGATFSLDDFGTGTSNMACLIEMPVSTIKFDFGMTKAYQKREKAKYAVDSIIELAHKLGMHVVIEGVEDKDEFKLFSEINIDYIQGFYFSTALSEENFIEFAKKNNMEA